MVESVILATFVAVGRQVDSLVMMKLTYPKSLAEIPAAAIQSSCDPAGKLTFVPTTDLLFGSSNFNFGDFCARNLHAVAHFDPVSYGFLAVFAGSFYFAERNIFTCVLDFFCLKGISSTVKVCLPFLQISKWSPSLIFSFWFFETPS